MSSARFSAMDPRIEELLSVVRHNARQLHRLMDEASRSDLENTEKERLWAETNNQAEQLNIYQNQIETWLQLNRKVERRVKKCKLLARTEIQHYLDFSARDARGNIDGTSSSSSSSLRPGFHRTSGTEIHYYMNYTETHVGGEADGTSSSSSSSLSPGYRRTMVDNQLGCFGWNPWNPNGVVGDGST